jgi:hypothetical protein
MKIVENKAKEAKMKIDNHNVSEDKLKARIVAIE